jgi:hypothetical protein
MDRASAYSIIESVQVTMRDLAAQKAALSGVVQRSGASSKFLNLIIFATKFHHLDDALESRSFAVAGVSQFRRRGGQITARTVKR